MGGGEETEKERMCERQPDEPLLGGVGAWAVWGAPSVPPDMLECPVLGGQDLPGQDDARWVAHRVVCRMGPEGLGLGGVP